MKRLRTIMLTALALAGLWLPGAVSAFTFSPPTFDLDADPGQRLRPVIKLRNESPDPVTLTATSSSFAGKSGDETLGTPDFYPSGEVRDGHGLGAWLAFETATITLLPGERAELPFTISVPSDAEPGSYLGAVILAAESGQAGDQIGVLGTAAVLVFVRVSGPVSEELQLKAFAAPKVSDSLPVHFEAYVENKGTVHLRPHGEITIKNVFGQTVATLAINRAEYKSVLPGLSRKFGSDWTGRPAENSSALSRQWKNFALGPYTAELTLRYGQEERIVKSTTRFWVVPWLALLLFVTGSWILVWSLRRFLVWYHDRIIRRHNAQN